MDLDLPYLGDRLVLNGVLIHGRAVEVNVSRSNAPTGFAPPTLFVDQARVEIYVNGVFETVLQHAGRGRYVATQLIAQTGNAYRVVVRADGFVPVEATTVVPGAFPLQRVDFQFVNSLLNPSKPAAEMDVQFIDDGHTTDFYAISITGFTNSDRTEKDLTPLWIPGALDEMDPPCNYFRNRRFIYEDRCFNGTATIVSVGAETEIVVPDGTRLFEISFDHVVVRCQKISPELFDYYFSNTSVSGIALAFFEPSFLRGNVHNGYGVLGAVNEVVVQQKIDR